LADDRFGHLCAYVRERFAQLRVTHEPILLYSF
jgi:hypothetical protein